MKNLILYPLACADMIAFVICTATPFLLCKGIRFGARALLLRKHKQRIERLKKRRRNGLPMLKKYQPPFPVAPKLSAHYD